MAEYHEVDVNGDGRTDAVWLQDKEDGSSDVYVDSDRDGVIDYVLDYRPDGTFYVHTGEYEVSDANQATVDSALAWSESSPDENET